MRALWAHKVRTSLTMFGIAWGIVSITLMVAAGEGLRVGQKKQAESFGKDIMIVFAGRTSLQAGGVRAGRPIQWTDTDHLAVEAEATVLRICSAGARAGRHAGPQPYNSGALLVTGSLPAFA